MSINGHGPLERLTIVNLDGQVSVASGSNRTELVAQYNPKELQVDKGATWESTKGRGDNPELHFKLSTPRSMQLELFFDTYESGADVHDTYVKHLQALTMVMNRTPHEDQKRPPRVAILWGGGVRGVPKFTGVVESVSTKYTMFLPDGTAVRATCSVKLLEADRSSFTRTPPR